MFAEILKITIPGLLVFLATYLTLSTMFQNETKRRKIEFLKNNQKITLPLRLQAYERLTMLLERISPDSLILRTNKPGMTAQNLQSAMLGTIRAEWEHNLSQQLYVSVEAWELVKNAKGNVIKLVNVCADKTRPDDPSINLSQKIFETMVEFQSNPIDLAINYMKKEVREFF
jgi:hypothetical protein